MNRNSRKKGTMEGNSSTALPEMMACMLGYEICHEPWAFYYDETENCRLIRYGERGIVDPRTMERDFILGGIALTDPSVYETMAQGVRKLPQASGEAKASAVLSTSDNFLYVLKRRELTDFLQLIDRPGVLVHYRTQNNFYYSIVDIVDSVIPLSNGKEILGQLHRELKDVMYACVADDRTAFINSLMRFGYPNIAADQVQPFCSYLEDVLASAAESNPLLATPDKRLLVNALKHMLRTASETNSLVFLEGNDENILVSGFSAHYQLTCMSFPMALHCFDNETHISMSLLDTSYNYKFVDSKAEPLVQLADVWVGLLSRLFRFLDEYSTSPNPRHINPNAARVQLENLATIKRLIDRADETHKALISNCSPISTIVRRYRTLEKLCDLRQQP